MTPAALAIVALIDSLVLLPERGPREVATATGAELRPVSDHPTWVEYRGISTTGPCRDVELRADKVGSTGLVILKGFATPTAVGDLDLEKYGPKRSVSIAPPNGSSWSERYSYEGFDLAFSFAVGSDELTSVVLTKK